MPRPRPQPVTPRPKASKPKPNVPLPESAPDEIEWNDTAGKTLSDEEFDEADLFGRFSDMSDLNGDKPVMIYFFWPDEDEESDDKNIANQVRRCKLMDEILTNEDIRKASTLFHCFKCDAKELSDKLKSKYKIKVVPKVLFFDVKGRKLWQLTSTKAKPKGVSKKMIDIAAKCMKLTSKKSDNNKKSTDPGGGGANPPSGGG